MRKAFWGLVAAVVLSACDPQPVSLQLKLYGQGAGFTGQYTVDDGEDVTNFTASETTSGVYLYSTSLEAAEGVIVDVFPEGDEDGDTDMTDLTCRIFDEAGTVVYESSLSISSVLMKTFVFNISDMETTTTE